MVRKGKVNGCIARYCNDIGGSSFTSFNVSLNSMKMRTVRVQIRYASSSFGQRV